jgi:proline racemase
LRESLCMKPIVEECNGQPSILHHKINTPKWGTVVADIAFDGVFYALAEAIQLGFDNAPENARDLAEAGIALKALLSREVKVSHPELPGLDDVASVMIRSCEPDGAIRTCTTLRPGRVDRSPCGTGVHCLPTCAVN